MPVPHYERTPEQIRAYRAKSAALHKARRESGLCRCGRERLDPKWSMCPTCRSNDKRLRTRRILLRLNEQVAA